MKKTSFWAALYGVVALVFLLTVYFGNHAVTVISESMPIERSHTILLDAGHGGEDGGTSSCTGRPESTYNLEITLCLNDLLHLLGYDTKLIRDSDISVYTKGETIAQKKVSDLKERVRMVSETSGALLVSIHQNHFSDSRYSGAQVFYANTPGSKELAGQLQAAFVSTLNPGSRRAIKKGEGIYLLDHIDCTGILVECGFLSNPQEAEKLATKAYQQKLSAVIATELSRYLSNT